MKSRVLVMALFFSLAFNLAALVAFIVSRPAGGCPVHDQAGAAERQLNLAPEQQEQFARLDALYHEQRRAAAERLRELRQELLRRVLDEKIELGSLEEMLARTGEEQSALQRRLIENFRAKVLLLDPGQREVYRKLVENLAGGCGCVGCTEACH